VLDGGIDDWVAAKRPTETSPTVLPEKSYTATIKPELLATYEYVKSGDAQIVDARSLDEFGAESIPGAVNIPYDNVLDKKRIKDEADLKKLFSGLSKDRPVVVYTDTGVKATMVWFALDLLGYDARVYSWEDWLANQPRLNISLQEAKADPNPAKIGSVVTITAIFQEEMEQGTEQSEMEQGQTGQDEMGPEQIEQPPTAEEIEKVAPDATGAFNFADASNATDATDASNSTDTANETILTIKGCATCGFGSPQGFADLSSGSGVVQIGSKSNAQVSASNDGFKCTARITSPSGTEVDKVIMKRVSGDEFAGIWNANVASGTYDVTIVASAGDITKTFPSALKIEVAGSSKFKNLG
jgi:thiosulfate/3-mercaptopyruvate sulfurtransferase